MSATASPTSSPPPYHQAQSQVQGQPINRALQTVRNRAGGAPQHLTFTQSKSARNLDHALKAVACKAANLVKLTVFIRNMDDLASYRRARDAYFHEAGIKPPAVTLVEVSRLFAPELLIEIEAIAVS